MNEFELIHAILQRLHDRMCALEAEAGSPPVDYETIDLLDRLDRVIPKTMRAMLVNQEPKP